MEKVIERLDKVEEYIDDLDSWKDGVEKNEEEQEEVNDYLKGRINRVKDEYSHSLENIFEKFDRLGERLDKFQFVVVSLLGGIMAAIIALCGILVSMKF